MSISPATLKKNEATQVTITRDDTTYPGFGFGENWYAPATVECIQGATTIAASSIDSWGNDEVIVTITITLPGLWDLKLTRDDGQSVTVVGAITISPMMAMLPSLNCGLLISTD